MKKFSIILMFAVFSEGAFANVGAFCVKLAGDKLIQRNLFSSADIYYRLEEDSEIYAVESSSEEGLLKLCPYGHLVTTFKEVRLNRGMPGTYLKNPVFFAPTQKYKVVSDVSSGGSR